jgi:hypothetical protein
VAKSEPSSPSAEDQHNSIRGRDGYVAAAARAADADAIADADATPYKSAAVRKVLSLSDYASVLLFI